ncbi:cytochrome B [Methylovirgula ligni]|uniref:Cytochrome b561 n=1 Tax=Methylovirgula ligni TaxID=569860 RepID=A0A3D9YUB4_9HYPH|nr:cytochrome b/b6 domain-containing protein [Methylovirgula ligni]QAY96117.1 cytochrome B [Methylovirgula ligni]REF86197.1 cytochrome b561 [Methylovirgula ligni]
MHYDSRTIALHWTTAGLVLILWTIGQTADFIPRGPFRGAYWSAHFLLGFIFVAVLLTRILWRSSGGKRLPPADSGALQVISKTTHYLLYALLVIVAALGLANAFAHGVSIFGIINLPKLADHARAESIGDLHELAANSVLALAAFHAAAALAHHYLWRDKVLERMLPERAS